MNFLKVTTRDMKKIFKNRFIGISVIAIIITPLFYSLFYLSSFWDPYGNLENMPVAVVNLDKGTTNDNNRVNYGNDLIDELKSNKDVGWRFVSQDDADKGLTGNKYYGEFIIPEDFSEKALSAKDGTPQKPNIVFKDNPKKNYIATKIDSSVKTNLDTKITESLVKEYTKVIVNNLYDVKDGMNQAADGSSKVTEGASSLKDGSNQLKTGMANAKNGSTQLKTGLYSLKDGSNQLQSGLSELNNQVPAFQFGVSTLANGGIQLSSGLSSIKDGSSQLQNGLASASNGSTQLRDGLKSLNDQLPQLQSGTKTLADGSQKVSYGLRKVAGVLTQIDSKVNSKSGLISSLGKINDNTKELGLAIGNLNNSISGQSSNESNLSDSVTGLNKGMNQLSLLLEDYNNSRSEDQRSKYMEAIEKLTNSLKDGTENLNVAVNEGTTNKPSLKKSVEKLNVSVNGDSGLSYGVSSIYSAVSNPKSGLGVSIDSLNSAVNIGNNDNPSLLLGIQKLNSGIIDLNNKTPEIVAGTAKLYKGALDLSDGNNQLYMGAVNLNNGTNKLYTGAMNLNNGLSTLNNSTSSLVYGVNKLYTGASGLSEGTSQLYTGASSLSEGTNKIYNGVSSLNDGTNKIYNGSKELTNKLSDGSNKLNSNLKNSSTTMANFISQPVNVETKHLFADETYGTALAPYFIPISIWVGAILMFFVVPDEVDKDLKLRAKSIVIGKYLVYIGIGLLQAICVSTAVLLIGIRPSNLLAFYLFNIFISFVFISIMQCLIFLLKDVGRLLGIIILVLQLASSAGTFPIELSPKFYRVISPFMPFTYVVSGLREVINGINYSVLWKDISFLVLVFIIFFTLSLALRGRVTKIHEIIEVKKNESVA